MIQVINIQPGKIQLKINGVDCVFMPMEVFTKKSFIPLRKKVKGSALYWHINGDVSYNQVKAAIIFHRSKNYISTLPLKGNKK